MSVFRPDQSEGLSIKEISAVPSDVKLTWDPIHLTSQFSRKSEIAVLVMPRGETDLITLPAQEARERATWDLPQSAGVVAVVLGPDGLNMKKVKSLVAENEDLFTELAD